MMVVDYLIGAGLVAVGLSGIRVVSEWEDGLVFTFGKYSKTKTAGLRWIIPVVQSMRKVDKRVRTIDVSPQEIMTKDSVPAKLDAVIYFKVKDTKKAVIEVEDFNKAAYKFAQTALRDTVGKYDLDTLLEKKGKMGNEIKKKIQGPTNEWGIKVDHVEIRDVVLPKNMKRAMAKEAEASREKKARKIKASGEKEASKMFNEAADKMGDKAMMLRQFQTMQEIGVEHNTTMFMIPSEFASAFKSMLKEK